MMDLLRLSPSNERPVRPRLPVLGIVVLICTGCAVQRAGTTEVEAALAEPAATPAVAAPASAEEKGTEETEEAFSNTIRWATASEVENFGFDVYRGDAPDGPFERLNETVIEGGGTVDTPRKYAYEDTTIDPCAEYFYYVESIALSGEREKFTPVGRARAKLDADDPRCTSDEG